MIIPKRSVRFLDYLNAGGRNLIREWLHGIPVGARQKITARLEYLENPENWHPPQVKPLTGYKGLLEIRIWYGKVLYRPLVWRGPDPGNATILVGAEEKGNRFDPPNAPDTAVKRRAEILKNPTRLIDHDYS